MKTHLLRSAALGFTALFGITALSGAEAADAVRGGTLTIDWDGANGSVIMTGPAATVFEGTIEI